jgi:hypothetical protein
LPTAHPAVPQRLLHAACFRSRLDRESSRECHDGWVFREDMVRKSDVLSDVVLKTAYFSLALAALIFVSMLVLTTLHP